MSEKKKKSIISSDSQIDPKVKAEFITNLVKIGFKFGGIVSTDRSVLGPVVAKDGKEYCKIVDFTMIFIDEDGDGYEIKGRPFQFALYEIHNFSKSTNRTWYNYNQAKFVNDELIITP